MDLTRIRFERQRKPRAKAGVELENDCQGKPRGIKTLCTEDFSGEGLGCLACESTKGLS